MLDLHKPLNSLYLTYSTKSLKLKDSFVELCVPFVQNAKKDSSFYGRTGIENLTTTLLDLILGGKYIMLNINMWVKTLRK